VPVQTPLIVVVVVALLYLRGARGSVGGRERAERGWRTALFLAGLATIAVALLPPIDSYSDSLFSVHMLQHVLLLEIAPPLLVLGRPWTHIWRLFPLSRRRTLAHELARSGWAAPLRWLGRPSVAFLLMNGSFLLWHLPALYDAALANQGLHVLEHVVFLSTAVLFWMHLLGDGPFKTRLTPPWRAAYAIGAMVVGWALAVVIATAPSPLYAHYADLPTRPWGLSALADQQLAAGVMWVPASVPWTVLALVCLYGWLDPNARRRSWVRGLVGEH
jgi:putative membrane protein